MKLYKDLIDTCIQMSQHIDKEAFIDQMTQKCLEMREKDPEMYAIVMDGLLDKIELNAHKQFVNDVSEACKTYAAHPPDEAV